MPIIIAHSEDAPLSQGDVLRGVKLYSTRNSGSPDGGEWAEQRSDFSMVLSRPCVASRKEAIIVAPISKFTGGVPKDLGTFKAVLAFLTKYRDGHGTPDTFYLGQFPSGDAEGRYAVRFESLHTIQVPTGDAERREFARAKRVFTLAPDFVRDLHVRVFCAFASLGFEDQGWLSTEDLDWLVQKGEAELAQHRLNERNELADQAAKKAEGQQFGDKALKTAQKAIAELGSNLEPYREELKNRRH